MSSVPASTRSRSSLAASMREKQPASPAGLDAYGMRMIARYPVGYRGWSLCCELFWESRNRGVPGSLALIIGFERRSPFLRTDPGNRQISCVYFVFSPLA